MKINRILLLAAAMTFICSCEDAYQYPEWIWNDGTEEPAVPEDPDDPDDPGTPDDSKPRYVWIDASANFSDYANSQENIAADLQKIKDAGFTDIIVDVRPTSGNVLFSSASGTPLTRIDAWTSNGYVWLERTETFDYLQAFIDAGHALGLGVNASINTFVGGYLCPYGLGSDGMLFDDPSRKDWATSINAESGIVNTMDLLLLLMGNSRHKQLLAG